MSDDIQDSVISYGVDIAEDGTETLCEVTVVDGLAFHRFVVLGSDCRG